MKAGDVFVVPSGCLVTSSTQDLLLLRWARLGKNEAELRKVLMSMTLAQQAFPSQCVGFFADLLQYVEGQVAALRKES